MGKLLEFAHRYRGVHLRHLANPAEAGASTVKESIQSSDTYAVGHMAASVSDARVEKLVAAIKADIQHQTTSKSTLHVRSIS